MVAALTEGDLSDDTTKPVVRLCQARTIPWLVLGKRFPEHPRHYGRWLNELQGELRQLRPDVLMPYCILPNTACGLAWGGAGARTCIWNQRDEGIGRLAPELTKLAVWSTPRFISNSTRGADYLISRLGVPAARCRVIPNGVALSPPVLRRDEWRRQLKIGSDVFAVCMLAILNRTKDHRTLIRAWRSVVDRCSAAGMEPPVLVLAGYFSNTTQELRKLTRELNLETQIRFIGRTDDVSGLFRAMDICVHSSESEGLPNAILEAMGAGLAVVATDIPGSRLALGPHGARWLAPPRDPGVLADRIFELARNESTRLTVGGENRKRVLAEFPVRRLVDETVAAISAALGDESQPRPPRHLVRAVRGVALFLLLMEASLRVTAWLAVRRFISRTPLLWRLLRG